MLFEVVMFVCRHARTFVFFYSIALHILVFLSMYRMSSYSHQRYPMHFHAEHRSTAATLLLCL